MGSGGAVATSLGTGAPPLPYLREGAGAGSGVGGPHGAWLLGVGGVSGGVVDPLPLPGLGVPAASLKATFKHLPSVGGS